MKKFIKIFAASILILTSNTLVSAADAQKKVYSVLDEKSKDHAPLKVI